MWSVSVTLVLEFKPKFGVDFEVKIWRWNLELKSLKQKKFESWRNCDLEIWSWWNLKLKCEIEIWSWRNFWLKRFENEYIWCWCILKLKKSEGNEKLSWSLKLKYKVQVWSLKFKVKVWGWALMLKFEAEVWC